MALSIVGTRQLSRVTARFRQWGWLEIFVLVQVLSTALLFLPGTQSIRFFIRVLPYILSLGLMFFFLSRPHRTPLAASRLLLLAFVLLVLNLLQPTTQFKAGLAQILFQLCIAAPVFWVGKAVENPQHLGKLLWLIFLANAISTGVGLLQIYYPEHFMPPAFSALALTLNPYAVEALIYTGADGREIIRPPGLSDMPGGAATSGMMAGILGLALGIRFSQGRALRLFCLAVSGIGMVVLYLTQVRSLFVMMVVALVVLIIITARQGQPAKSSQIALISVGLIVGSFLSAVAIGGESVSERFLHLAEEGLFTSYQQNRGGFLDYTINELMYEYPLGAGLGRWGMMQVYFGEPDIWAPPIHVEIQITGWLLDGGVLMWLFYGGAIAAAMAYAYRLAMSRCTPTLANLAGTILCLQLIIVGMSMAGPAFNTQLGIQFWTLTAALHGAASSKLNRTRTSRKHMAL